MRIVCATLVALSLIGTSAIAGTSAEPATKGPLPPGKPAGVKNAAIDTATWVYIVGGAVVVAGIAIAASGGSDNVQTVHTTPTTST
jgi:hypothetical protein